MQQTIKIKQVHLIMTTTRKHFPIQTTSLTKIIHPKPNQPIKTIKYNNNQIRWPKTPSTQ
jgi:hypothetical protein